MKIVCTIILFLISFSVMPFTSKFVSNVYAQTVATLTKGNYQLKIFIQNSDTIEVVVNDWLASQEDIIVDQIKANNSTGNFSVIIRYHSGSSGKVSTRIKFFDTNTAVNVPKSSGETPEAWTQNSISAFSSEHNIHFVDVLTGNGPWDMFVVYDDREDLASDVPLSSELIDKTLDDEAASTSIESIISDVRDGEIINIDSIDDQIASALISGALVFATTTETIEHTGTTSSQMATVSEAGSGIANTVVKTFLDIIGVDDGTEIVPTPEALTGSPVEETIKTPVSGDTNTNDTTTTTF